LDNATGDEETIQTAELQKAAGRVGLQLKTKGINFVLFVCQDFSSVWLVFKKITKRRQTNFEVQVTT
jgi:hypothetical protein